MKKESIRERRLKALYEYSRNHPEETLGVLLAILPHSIVKEVVEDLNIRIDKTQP